MKIVLVVSEIQIIFYIQLDTNITYYTQYTSSLIPLNSFHSEILARTPQHDGPFQDFTYG